MDYKVTRLIGFYEKGYDETAIIMKDLINGIIKRGHTENAKLIEIIKYTIKEFNTTKRLIRWEFINNEELKNEYITFTNKLIFMLKKELKQYERIENNYVVKD